MSQIRTKLSLYLWRKTLITAICGFYKKKIDGLLAIIANIMYNCFTIEY